MKIIYVLVFVLTLSLVSAYGGDNYTVNIKECDDLWFNLTGSLNIDDGEYIIYSECSETYKDQYYCNCSNDYNLTLGFELNTVNNYTLSIIFDYYKEVSSGGSGGSGGRRYKYNYNTAFETNKTKDKVFFSDVSWEINNQAPILKNDTIIEEINDSSFEMEIDNEPIELEVEVIAKKSKMWFYVLIGIIILIIIIFIVVKWYNNDNNYRLNY